MEASAEIYFSVNVATPTNPLSLTPEGDFFLPCSNENYYHIDTQLQYCGTDLSF
jgi:hypothetical protein